MMHATNEIYDKQYTSHNILPIGHNIRSDRKNTIGNTHNNTIINCNDAHNK